MSGRTVLDTCGQPFITRGIEQAMWWAPEHVNFVDAMAAAGANAVRFLVNHQDMTWADVDSLFARATSKGLVVYWSLYTAPPNRGLTGASDINYWNLPEVKSLYQKYRKWIIIDAVQETTDSATVWRDQTIARIQQLRAWGYDCPFDVISNFEGRNLPTILDHGAEVEAGDPLHKTILGWQAYWYEEGHPDWNETGWTYQGEYGMSLTEGIRRAAQQAFPVQIGIDKWTEQTELQYMDYSAAMAAAQQYGVPWMWWDWVVGGVGNAMSDDGYHLNALGTEISSSNPNGLLATAHLACGR